MATLKPELKAILERYGIDPRDTSQVWDCRGTLVLYHKAYEIIAAKENITFDPPQVVRKETKEEAVILVVGHMGERAEWSFGEAVIGQNYHVSGKQAAYPWAMAEKRAKDRVIAKLVGLAQYVYSEDEAEEFKNGERKPVEMPAPEKTVEELAAELEKAINACPTQLAARELWTTRKADFAKLKAARPEMVDALTKLAKTLPADAA